MTAYTQTHASGRIVPTPFLDDDDDDEGHEEDDEWY